MDTAVPLGLIVNELVANALEHAFVGRDQGRITISLSAGGDAWELRVSDDGVGLPRGFDLEHESTLGLRLVSNLARQLDGDLSLLPSGGASWRLRFPHG
jgi:two-component sensor histidine kinase